MASIRLKSGESANYATAGFTFAGTILIFGGAGYAIDHWIGTEPWLMVLGLVAGAVGGFIRLVIAFSPQRRSPDGAPGSSRDRR